VQKRLSSAPVRPLILLGGLALVIGAPLLGPFILTGNDAYAYYLHAQQTAANLRDGVLWPAFSADYNWGYGGLGQVIYPPFTSYLHAMPALVGLSLIRSAGVLAVLAMLLSGATAYLWLREDLPADEAVPLAAIYMTTPYRIVCLHVRSSFGEHWAFAFAPLLMWALTARSLRLRTRVLVCCASITPILLSNLPAAVLLLGVIGVAVLLIERLRSRLGAFVAAGVLSCGVAAFALVPQALTSRWVTTEREFGPLAGSFRCSANTLFSQHAVDVVFTQRVSFAFVLTVGLAVLAAVLAWRSSAGRREHVVWAALAVGFLVLTLKPAGILWDATPVIRNLQFPWRLGAPLSLAVVALARGARARHAWLLLGATCAAGAPWMWVSIRPARVLATVPAAAPSDRPTLPDIRAGRESGALALDLSLANPRLIDKSFWLRAETAEFRQELLGRGSPAFDRIRGNLAVLEGSSSATITPVLWRRLVKQLEVESERGGTLVWHILPIEGTELRLDGRVVDVGVQRSTGLVAQRVGPGKHTAAWRWRAPRPLGYGRVASVISVALIVLLACWRRAARPTPSS
jgi:hypothetical protein